MTPWTAACQPPLSMGFPRQELPFTSPGDLPDPGIEPKSPVSLLHCRWTLYHWAIGEALPQRPVCKHAKSLQSCPTLCSSPGSSVHRILQARILEWVAISFSTPRGLVLIKCLLTEFQFCHRAIPNTQEGDDASPWQWRLHSSQNSLQSSKLWTVPSHHLLWLWESRGEFTVLWKTRFLLRKNFLFSFQTALAGDEWWGEVPCFPSSRLFPGGGREGSSPKCYFKTFPGLAAPFPGHMPQRKAQFPITSCFALSGLSTFQRGTTQPVPTLPPSP